MTISRCWCHTDESRRRKRPAGSLATCRRGVASVTSALMLLSCLSTADLLAMAPLPAAADAASDYPSSVLTDRPLSYWQLNETSGTTARDQQGQTDGAIEGGVTLGRPGPWPGTTSMGFDGGSCTGINLNPGADRFSLQNLTLEAWIRTSTQVDQTIFRRRFSGYILRTFGGLASFAGVGTDISSTQVTDGKWHHIVATIDSTAGRRLYVDGDLVDQTDFNEPVFYAGLQAAIGRDGDACDGVNPSFAGDLAQVSIYDHALDAGRVKAHFAAAPQGPANRMLLSSGVQYAWAHVTAVSAAFEGSVRLGTVLPRELDLCSACTSQATQSQYAKVAQDLSVDTEVRLYARVGDRTFSSLDPLAAQVFPVLFPAGPGGAESYVVGWDLDGDGAWDDASTTVWSTYPLSALWGSRDPEDELQEPGGHQGSWGKKDLTYAVSGAPSSLTSFETSKAITSAFAELERATTFSFRKVSATSDPDMVINFERKGINGTIAASDAQYRLDGDGKFQRPVTITANASKFWTMDKQRFPLGRFAADPSLRPPPKTGEPLDDPRLDLQSILLHEIGHSLGAAHSPCTDEVMYWLFNGSNRVLTTADVDRIDPTTLSNGKLCQAKRAKRAK